jgi:hypothetical protein
LGKRALKEIAAPIENAGTLAVRVVEPPDQPVRADPNDPTEICFLDKGAAAGKYIENSCSRISYGSSFQILSVSLCQIDQADRCFFLIHEETRNQNVSFRVARVEDVKAGFSLVAPFRGQRVDNLVLGQDVYLLQPVFQVRSEDKAQSNANQDQKEGRSQNPDDRAA